MSNDTIKRSDAIKALDNAWINGTSLLDANEAVKQLNDLPSADRPQGEWICHKGKWIDFDYYPTKYECDQCHHYVDVASDKNFCPNCGADMRERKESE